MKPLVKRLAIPLSNQKTVAKCLVIAIRLSNQPESFGPGTRKALHSHSAKSPKYGGISRWLTIAKSLVMSAVEGESA
jgi:hypothetical protein